MIMEYILDEHGMPVPCKAGEEWGDFMRSEAAEPMSTLIGPTEVKTIFAGVDFNDGTMGDDPLVFETRVYGGKMHEILAYSPNKALAIEMHEMIVKKVRDKWALHLIDMGITPDF
jgi:hypothetical protein